MMSRLLKMKDATQKYYINTPPPPPTTTTTVPEQSCSILTQKRLSRIALNVLAERRQVCVDLKRTGWSYTVSVVSCQAVLVLHYLYSCRRASSSWGRHSSHSSLQNSCSEVFTARVQGMDVLTSLQTRTALDPRFTKLKCFPKEKQCEGFNLTILSTLCKQTTPIERKRTATCCVRKPQSLNARELQLAVSANYNHWTQEDCNLLCPQTTVIERKRTATCCVCKLQSLNTRELQLVVSAN